jgi:hypothetical protein
MLHFDFLPDFATEQRGRRVILCALFALLPAASAMIDISKRNAAGKHN